MNALDISQRDGEFVVTSETVANGAGIQHASVLRLVDDNRADFEDFGHVRFEIRPGYNNSQVRIALLNEQQATLLMTFQRNTDQVRAFKKALVKAFFEMSHRSSAVASRRDLALMVLEAEDEADRQRARAEVAEEFKTAIESNEGLPPRKFHKKYFADVSEREFFEMLYRTGLLIDQRGKGTQRDDGSWRDGSQHRHPSFKGKQFFYLVTDVNRAGYRFEQTHVRPGEPELALVDFLTRRGLSKEIAA